MSMGRIIGQESLVLVVGLDQRRLVAGYPDRWLTSLSTGGRDIRIPGVLVDVVSTGGRDIGIPGVLVDVVSTGGRDIGIPGVLVDVLVNGWPGTCCPIEDLCATPKEPPTPGPLHGLMMNPGQGSTTAAVFLRAVVVISNASVPAP